MIEVVGTWDDLVIRELRAGITWVNTYHPTFNEMPWGGYKQSGNGRELGRYGLDEFVNKKLIRVIGCGRVRRRWRSGR